MPTEFLVLCTVLFCLWLLAFGLVCALMGYQFTTHRLLHQSRLALDKKVEEWDMVTAKACEANNSIGEKVVEAFARIDNIEAWRSMIDVNSKPTTGWRQ